MSSSEPNPLKVPPNHGRIVLEHNNTESLRFWIRVFELESQLAFAQAQFNEHSAAAPDKAHDPLWAVVPIINEYDAGHIKWIYVLIAELDVLGICGGSGIIYFADQDNEAKAYEARDRFADSVMEQTKRRAKAGKLTEIFRTESGAQD